MGGEERGGEGWSRAGRGERAGEGRERERAGLSRPLSGACRQVRAGGGSVRQAARRAIEAGHDCAFAHGACPTRQPRLSMGASFASRVRIFSWSRVPQPRRLLKLSSGAAGTQTLFRRLGHTNSLPAPRAHKLSSGAAGTQTLFRRRGHTNSLLAPRAHKLSSGAAGTQLSCPHLVSVLRGPPPRRGQHRAASCQCRARLYKRYIEVQRYIEAKHATSCQCPARLLSRRHSAQYHSCVRARADALCRADALGKLPAFIENQ